MNRSSHVVVRSAAVLAVSLPAIVAGAAVGGATVPPTTSAGVDLDVALTTFVGDRPGGAVLLMVRDGVTTTAAAGAADSAGTPMTVDTVFRVGSVTKPFVATIVLQLVDEGRVDLDAPLSTYLPETTIGGDVRIRDLLRHRSGLPNYVDDAFVADALADPAHVYEPDELLAYVADIAPGEADQEYEYSDTNFLLLGQLIEALEATDLNTVLADRITEPLGLTVTHVAVPGEPVDGLAGGWYADSFDGDPAAPYDSIASGAWAAGGIVSTAGELRTFLAALFGGELISAAALGEMTATEPDDYGLGLGLLELPSGTRLYGHDGDIFGYLSIAAIEPVTGDILVVLVNNSELQPFTLAEELLADW